MLIILMLSIWCGLGASVGIFFIGFEEEDGMDEIHSWSKKQKVFLVFLFGPLLWFMCGIIFIGSYILSIIIHTLAYIVPRVFNLIGKLFLILWKSLE